jgi:O-acetyl-ADP-ribose deacetylase (regulator of RNase III)
MTLVHLEGNIFNTTQPTIGHGVNTRGYMGSGIAKTVRELYPSVYYDYKAECRTPGLNGGDHFPSKAREYTGPGERWILNIASQEAEGRSAQYIFLETALERAFDWVTFHEHSGVALPKIGAGIGGLEWNDALAIIENRASHYPDLDVEVWSFIPEAYKF